MPHLQCEGFNKLIRDDHMFQIKPLLIPGPVGNLEAELTEPDNPKPNHFAVICHPHPLHGGTMHNKVITTVGRAFRELSITTLRFNFRGVGKSEGEFDHATGETEDLLAVLTWVEKQNPKVKINLVGFSFGAYIAYRAAQQKALQQLILIAPAVHHHDFTQNAFPDCPTLVLQPEEDEIVPPDAVYQWIEENNLPTKLIRFPKASHFFHGKLIELRETLKKHIYVTSA